MNPIEIIKWNFDYLFNLAGLDSGILFWLWLIMFVVSVFLLLIWLIKGLAVLFRRQPSLLRGVNIDQFGGLYPPAFHRPGLTDVFPPSDIIKWVTVFFLLWWSYGNPAEFLMIIIVLVVVIAFIRGLNNVRP